ncbi:MAG: hypothetical protein ACK559_19855, partial [bacterium]
YETLDIEDSDSLLAEFILSTQQKQPLKHNTQSYASLQTQISSKFSPRSATSSSQQITMSNQGLYKRRSIDSTGS